MDFFSIKLVGVNEVTGYKLLLTVLSISLILLLRAGLNRLTYWLLLRKRNERLAFWRHQTISLITAILILLILLSIWFDDPRRLTTGLGLVTAGLAFALQRVITSFAGYLLIMRGKTFNVGERITMGGVRGDVISLGFIQTTIMEMGQPESVKNADPAMWIGGRQYTGRIVTVTNDKIFDEPVYNYTRDFPFIWEEVKVPIKYGSDRHRAEQILLNCVREYTEDAQKLSAPLRKMLEEKYFIRIDDMIPRVYYSLTDNWLEMSVRFIVREHGIRAVKDSINRLILDRFEQEKIEIASATFEMVGMPNLQVNFRREELQPADIHSTSTKKPA